MRILYQIWRQRCRNEHDFLLVEWQRWWYALKASIVFLCSRERIDDLTWKTEHVNVAVLRDGSFGSDEFGTIYWADSIHVGWGYLRGWWFFYESDSSA